MNDQYSHQLDRWFSWLRLQTHQVVRFVIVFTKKQQGPVTY